MRDQVCAHPTARLKLPEPREPMATHSDPAAPATDASERCLSGCVRMLSRAVTCIYDEELRDIGIRSGQLNILGHLASRGRMTPAEVERMLLMERSTVSRTVRRMCDRGWIGTEPSEDARSHYLVVTDAGAAMLKSARPAWKRAQVRAREVLGKEGFDALLVLGDVVLGQQG